MYKLTISKALDRKGLANALKHISCLSLNERLHIVDNLPFIDEEMWSKESYVKDALSPYCEFTYEEIFPYHNNVIPFLESPLYLSAKNWYATLSKADQEKVDLLIQGSAPQG